MIFCKKPEPHGVCAECGVFFKPHSDKAWKDYCPTHAKPHIERDARRDLVLWYAKCNWEALESQAKEWDEKNKQSEVLHQAERMQQMAAMAANQQNIYKGLGGGPFGGTL